MAASCQGITKNIRLVEGLGQLHVIQQQLNTITDLLRDVQREVRELRSDSHICDENGQARLENSHMAAISAQELLQPLLSLQTGEAIDGFPATAAVISTMDAPHLHAHP